MHIYLFIVGIGLACFGLVLICHRLLLLSRSSTATGTLISYSLQVQEDEGRKEFFFPIISFQAKDGTNYRFTSVAGYDSRKFLEGKQFKIRYETQNPANALIDTFLHYWSGPFAVLLLGITAIATGATMIYKP